MTVPFEVKAVKESEDGKCAGEFQGYAAGIHSIDRVGDMILPGAFTADLPRFLKEGVVCWQHDWMTPIGVPLEASEDEYGLMTRSRISCTTQGKDAMTLIRDGVVKKLSIGYRVQDYEWVDRAGLINYLGSANLTEQRRNAIVQDYDEMELDECFLLKKIKLFEYSPVTIPANPHASITGAKSLLAGLTFKDQLLTALAAVREVKEHAGQIKALRAQDGRRLSVERKSALEEIAGELEEVAGEVRAVTADGEQVEQPTEPQEPNEGEQSPVDGVDGAEAEKLYLEFLQLEARYLRAA